MKPAPDDESESESDSVSLTVPTSETETESMTTGRAWATVKALTSIYRAVNPSKSLPLDVSSESEPTSVMLLAVKVINEGVQVKVSK